MAPKLSIYDDDFLNQVERCLNPGPKPMFADVSRLIKQTLLGSKFDEQDSVVQIFSADIANALMFRYTNDTDLFVKPTDMQSEHFAEGSFAVVYKAKLMGQEVAVKIMKQPLGIATPTSLKGLSHELEMWKAIPKHDNLLQLLGVSLTIDRSHRWVQFSLVSPFIGADLLNCPVTCHSPQQLRQFFLDIAQGLDHLHRHTPPIIHGDLRANNVLVSDGHAVLADFGLAKLGQLSHPTIPGLRSRMLKNWLAPELISDPTVPRSLKTDIYAFACTIIETFTKRPPIVTTAPVRPDLLRAAHWDDLWELLLHCLADKPDNRPDCSDLVSRVYGNSAATQSVDVTDEFVTAWLV